MLYLIKHWFRKFRNYFRKPWPKIEHPHYEIKYIILADTMQKADCIRQDMNLHKQEAILLSNRYRDNWVKIKGLWRDVMNDKIQLIGLNKDYFNYLYEGGRSPFELVYDIWKEGLSNE